jgi:hypothetical protein
MRRAKAAAGALAVAGALAAAVVSVSGCGAAATLDPVARAAEVTSQQPGARISLSMQLSSPSLSSGPLAITATGYVDARDKMGVMNMDLSRVPGISTLSGNGTAQIVFQYPVIYMDMPFLAGKLPEGKTWMKLDIRAAAQAAGVDSSQLGSFDQMDPSQFLSYLRASSGGVVSFGSETIDGTTTTHYHATLQLSDIVGRLPGDEQAAVRAGLEKLGEAGAIPVDVWVDSLGRVRREQLAIGAGAPAGAPVSGTITIDYKSFGAIPPIVAPPASEVFDATAAADAALKNGLSGGS